MFIASSLAATSIAITCLVFAATAPRAHTAVRLARPSVEPGDRGYDILRQQRWGEGAAVADAVRRVQPLTDRKVVPVGQAGSGLRGVRGMHVSESDPAMAAQPTGDAVSGRANAPAGGKIRG